MVVFALLDFIRPAHPRVTVFQRFVAAPEPCSNPAEAQLLLKGLRPFSIKAPADSCYKLLSLSAYRSCQIRVNLATACNAQARDLPTRIDGTAG